MEYINSIHKNKVAKVKNNLLTIEKYFRELKDRQMKIREQMEDLFLKPTVILPGLKKLFYQIPIPSSRPRKVDISH